MSPQTHAGIDYSKVDEVLSSYGYKKSNLIAILQKVHVPTIINNFNFPLSRKRISE